MHHAQTQLIVQLVKLATNFKITHVLLVRLELFIIRRHQHVKHVHKIVPRAVQTQFALFVKVATNF